MTEEFTHMRIDIEKILETYSRSYQAEALEEYMLRTIIDLYKKGEEPLQQ